MRARFIKQDNPLDSLDIGRVKERKEEKIQSLVISQMKDLMIRLNLDPSKLEIISHYSEVTIFRIAFWIEDLIYYITLDNYGKLHAGFHRSMRGTGNARQFGLKDYEEQKIKNAVEQIKEWYESNES